MKTADLNLDTVYAVKHTGQLYRAMVLAPIEYRVVKDYGNGTTMLAGYEPNVGVARGVNPTYGIPVLATFARGGVYLFGRDDELRAAALTTRAELTRGTLPELRAYVLLVRPAAILRPWAEHLDVLRIERETRERAQQARVDEQRAQDDARTRVLAVAGADAWRFYLPPSRWTELEALAVAYAARQGEST